MDNRLISFSFGLLLGLILYHWLFRPEIQLIEYTTEIIKRDTVVVEHRDTVLIREIKHEFLRDTVFFGYNLPINRFSTSYSHLYGNIDVSGEVAGEVLNMALKTDLRIPTVTNTIERERTRTIMQKPMGLYVGGVVDSEINLSPALWYQSDGFIFSYQYSFHGVHSLGIGRRVF